MKPSDSGGQIIERNPRDFYAVSELAKHLEHRGQGLRPGHGADRNRLWPEEICFPKKRRIPSGAD